MIGPITPELVTLEPEKKVFKKREGKSLPVFYTIFTYLINFNFLFFSYLYFDSFVLKVTLFIILESFILNLMMKGIRLTNLLVWVLVFSCFIFITFQWHSLVFIWSVITIFTNVIYLSILNAYVRR